MPRCPAPPMSHQICLHLAITSVSTVLAPAWVPLTQQPNVCSTLHQIMVQSHVVKFSSTTELTGAVACSKYAAVLCRPPSYHVSGIASLFTLYSTLYAAQNCALASGCSSKRQCSRCVISDSSNCRRYGSELHSSSSSIHTYSSEGARVPPVRRDWRTLHQHRCCVACQQWCLD
jgi:hypothetical protein